LKYKTFIVCLWAAAAAGTLILLGVGYFYSTHFPNLTLSNSNWGTFGDFFGGTLNPIFSFLSFILLLVTLSLQLNEREKRDIQYKQGLHDQLVENEERRIADNLSFRDKRFFELTSLMHEIAKSTSVGFGTHASLVEGHRSINMTWHKLDATLPKHNGTKFRRFNDVKKSYDEWRGIYWPHVGSYFELVFFIVGEFVTPHDLDQDIDREQREKYYMMLRAQLSLQERNILFYEMISSKVWHKYAQSLLERGFWRGGNDSLNKHRSDFIARSSIIFSSRESQEPST